MYRNSTIIPKKKICISCGRECIWFSKKRCQECARAQSVHVRLEKAAEEDLQELIKMADSVFSKYIRRSGEDANKVIRCYTCGKEMDFHDAQCGHFISRSALYLRWDSRNARNQCNTCNCLKSGNIPEYRKRLNIESPGLPDILQEESYIIWRPTREEIKQIILEYEQKLKNLK